jgi:hypothetical protein
MLADPAAVRRFADANERHADALDATALPTIDGWKGVAANMFRNRAALVTARRVELSSAHRSAAGHLRVFATQAEALLADMAVFARQQVAAMDDMRGLDFRIASAVDSGAADRLSGDRSACDRRRQAAAHSRDVALAELTAAEKRCADHIADLAHVAPLQPMPPGGYGPPAPGSGGPGTNGSLGWPSSSGANRKPPLDQIVRDFRTLPDEIVDWQATGVSGVVADILGKKNLRITKKEAALLDDRGLLDLRALKDMEEGALAEANKQFQGEGLKDGHGDAFRHAYWNAMMTASSAFGEKFSKDFTTAHEGRPGDPATSNAMDLYNNSIGRRIAHDNPGASRAELARLVRSAVNDGKLIVIDKNGEVAWSDAVPVGQTGKAK